MMKIASIAAMINEAPTVPKPVPPSAGDFVSTSPNVAPYGRVKTNAIQNRGTLGMLLKSVAMSTNASTPVIRMFAPVNPRPELSARKSPTAVPKVFETRIATQQNVSALNDLILSTAKDLSLRYQIARVANKIVSRIVVVSG